MALCICLDRIASNSAKNATKSNEVKEAFVTILDADESEAATEKMVTRFVAKGNREKEEYKDILRQVDAFTNQGGKVSALIKKVIAQTGTRMDQANLATEIGDLLQAGVSVAPIFATKTLGEGLRTFRSVVGGEALSAEELKAQRQTLSEILSVNLLTRSLVQQEAYRKVFEVAAPRI